MHSELMSINSAATALVAGLVTSLHCLGMCGPLACAIVPLRGPAGQPGADAQIVSTVYHLARLAGYAALGALFGALGRLPMIWLDGGVVRHLPWLLVAFFVVVAFRWDRHLPRVPLLGNIYLRVHGWGRARSPLAAAAALGLATPLLPCGPLYLVVALAMLGGSALRGVEFMLAFGLGTVPLLWLLQTNFHWIRLKLPPVWIARVQTGLALAAAVVIAWRLRGTLGLPGPGLDHFVCH
ncbi:MAG: sulfite exporter TauE/SafE family protein [Opitutaceae bacterium]|nr:sulfite exporter TauE/SafE family protein [Opitutaceae bacterium]